MMVCLWQGANALYPFGWEELLSLLDPTERENVLFAYYERLKSTDIPTQQRAVSSLELHCCPWTKLVINLYRCPLSIVFNNGGLGPVATSIGKESLMLRLHILILSVTKGDCWIIPL